MQTMSPYRAPYQQIYGQNNGINWVQGLNEAKSFPVPPNTGTILMDSINDGVFYIKVADSIGMSTLRTFDFTERVAQTTEPKVDTSQFVTREELSEIISKLNGGVLDEPVVSTVKSNTKSK